MKRYSKLSLRSLGWGMSLALTVGFVRTAAADVKLPAIFTSHMVLQQGLPDRVRGTAEPGEEVTVSIADQTKSAKAGDDGKWQVTLDPLKVGGVEAGQQTASR
jgi:sialate O-acetylesterase